MLVRLFDPRATSFSIQTGMEFPRSLKVEFWRPTSVCGKRVRCLTRPFLLEPWHFKEYACCSRAHFSLKGDEIATLELLPASLP